MNSPQQNTFKLSKRVRLISKLLGYKSAFELTGAQQLGRGMKGAVFSSKGAAIKVPQSNKDKKNLENEAKILKEIGSSRIAPKLLGGGKGYIAIQKYNGKPLAQYLSKINSDPVFADYIFRRTVEAIGHLHRKNIAHLDLHAGNILVTDNYEVKIIDYGQSRKGYLETYYETFLGTHNDPNTGAIGLIEHLFTKTKSYQTYTKLLKKYIEKICKDKSVDPEVVFTNYSSIEGNEEKEAEYFDSLHAISSPPAGQNDDVSSFYNLIDSGLRINTKNPVTIKQVQPKSSPILKGNTTRSINRKSSPKTGILKFEQGGIVPSGEQIVELHGEELVIPKKAIKKIKTNIHRDIAISNLIAYQIFPRTNEGFDKATKVVNAAEYWLAPSDLPQYYDDIDSDLLIGRETPGIIAIREILRKFYGIKSSSGTSDFVNTQIYKPEDKFVDDKKEVANNILNELDKNLDDVSIDIENNVDDFIEFDKKITSIGKLFAKAVKHPELYSDLQHIKTSYPINRHLIQLEFKSDIDRAIYYAGKAKVEQSESKIAVREWLFQVTGLQINDSELKDYREKIIDVIRTLVKLKGEEFDGIIPIVYDGYYQDPDEDEEYEDEEEYEETEDDLEDLDDLLSMVRNESDVNVDQIVNNIEEEIIEDTGDEENVDGLDELLNLVRAEEEDDEGDIGSEDDIPDELLQDDIDPKLLEELVNKINKPKKESSYTTNKKIFESITANFGRIQATLDVVNKNLEKQNELIKASIETQLAVGELISNQTNIMDQKFDLILKQFELQNAIARKEAEDEKKRSSESALEAQKDSAGVSDYQDLTKGSGNNRRQSRIEQYLKSRLTRKLYRKLPKSVRNTRQRIRKLQRVPGRLKDSAVKKITSLLPSQGKKAADALRKIRGMGRVGKIAGPARYAFAGLEYAERKESGQSEVQALSGVGVGLAGAAAGGAAGAKGGAAVGAAIGALFGGVGAAPGAAIGAVLGGLLGAIGGGIAGSSLSDKITGADKVQRKYETGTRLTKPGTAILHGTEAVVKKDAISNMSPMSTVGGVMLASTTQYLNSVGPIASQIAPIFEGIAGQMAKQYDVPSVITQTNIGGSLPSLGNEIKKVKEKRKKSLGEELSRLEEDLLETQDPESFAEKLLKMIDPEGRYQELLRNINNPTINPGSAGEVSAEPFVLLGGSQDPGQAGIDFTLRGTQNRAVLAGTVIEVKHQYNPNATGGDGRRGAGYGNYIVIRSTNPIDGSQVDMLYAHFPKGEIKVKEGDQVSVGQDLGRMATAEEYANPQTRKEVGSGTGPHTSLDFFTPGSNKAHPQARSLGDYILTELRKGSQGSIEKARQQAYQAQQSSRDLPTAQGLGMQGAAGNKNFGTTSGVGSKGYLIVPGHAAGGGAPEEKRLVKQLARNAYNNIKAKFPDANIHYQDTDSMFGDSEEGFKKQLQWFKQKEQEGWEIIEVHMDASMESGQGTGRGVIVPTGELNPVEAYFAQNYGAFARGHRDLGAPKRGVGIFELGNMSPELQQSSRQNNVSKQQLDALTAPLERSLQSGLNLISSPTSNQRTRFQSLQGTDNDNDTKFLIVNQEQPPNIVLPGRGAFIQMSPGRWRSNVELSTTMRNLYIQRLGQ